MAEGRRQKVEGGKVRTVNEHRTSNVQHRILNGKSVEVEGRRWKVEGGR